MKKLFSRFLKDTRGVVMMEYVVLGVFAVAVTVVAVMALGKAYTAELTEMALATVGETVIVEQQKPLINAEVLDDVTTAGEYFTNINRQNGSADFDWSNDAPIHTANAL